ncbi:MULTISPECIES: hypothetical protein [Mesorhizobium]|uniref:hypothetical protein n=1 Tax=Mesorhizobium TaxID=68287 RepID=UPI0010A95285|nr:MULTISPECIES: hypothetical protein [Mesorhizobium]
MKAYLACRLLKPEDAGLLPLIRHLVDEQSIYGYRRITAPALRIRSPREVHSGTNPAADPLNLIVSSLQQGYRRRECADARR